MRVVLAFGAGSSFQFAMRWGLWWVAALMVVQFLVVLAWPEIVNVWKRAQNDALSVREESA